MVKYQQMSQTDFFIKSQDYCMILIWGDSKEKAFHSLR